MMFARSIITRQLSTTTAVKVANRSYASSTILPTLLKSESTKRTRAAAAAAVAFASAMMIAGTVTNTSSTKTNCEAVAAVAVPTTESIIATSTSSEGGAIPVYGVPGTNRERTFLAIKPDGVQRGIIGDIIQRFEKRGYKLVGLKMVWPTIDMAAEHYADLSKKPFFPSLIKFFSSGPIVCMCWEGKDIIKQGRVMLGETQPLSSNPGSIRGDYSIDLGRNICHGSDTVDSAQHELQMWFPEGVNDWTKSVDCWVYESS